MFLVCGWKLRISNRLQKLLALKRHPLVESGSRGHRVAYMGGDEPSCIQIHHRQVDELELAR